MHNHQFIDFNDTKYLIKRIIKESQLKPGFDQQLLKEWTMSDVLLKREGLFYCCETLKDVEIIEQSEIQ
tara:strand:+ start:378 stop:584 length:207 start_codon:yes stop_codon:yes gene_type:complete